MYLQETYFFAFCSQVFDNFLHSTCDRTHCNQNMFCICSTKVVEQFVVSTCDFVDFVHVIFYDFRQTSIEWVCCFSVLEEYVRVLYCRTLYRVFWVQSIFTEFCQCFLVNQFFDVFIVHHFDFLQFVRSAETIKEMNKRYTAFDCSQMCYTTQVHNFLYRSGRKHSSTDLTTSHNVGMVTKNRECMCTNSSGTNMEYTRF